MLPEHRRSRPHTRRRLRQLDRRADHFGAADGRMVHFGHHLARRDLRIGEHLADLPDRAARHARVGEALDPLVACARLQAAVEQRLAARRSARRDRGWSRNRGSSARSAQIERRAEPAPDLVVAAGDDESRRPSFKRFVGDDGRVTIAHAAPAPRPS